MQQPFKAPYQDRQEAGRGLAQRLLAYKGRTDVIVLSASRGGVLVGAGVSEVLDAPLDIFFVRSVGVPGYEGLSMGTVARGTSLADKDAIERAGISMQTFLNAASAAQEELDRHESFYRSGRPAPTLTGHTIILVDEGLTGESGFSAVIDALHRHGVGEVIVAVPVAMQNVLDDLSKHVRECVCTHTIDATTSLEAWYEDSADVDDEAVRAALQLSAERLAREQHQEST